MPCPYPAALLLLLWLRPGPAPAQELPPPGGWPLRPVTTLRAVPEPPGGLVPYRQGHLWGFADTTGRVWIRPVFETEPPRFGAGLLLRAEVGPDQQARKRQPQQQPKLPRWLPSWNLRYGYMYQDSGDPIKWALSYRKPPKTGTASLLNVHGEQLLAQPHEAIVSAANGGWQVVRRPARATGQQELVAINASEASPYTYQQRLGRLFTTPLGPEPPAVPHRLTRQRAYEPDVTFTDFSSPAFKARPLYLAQKVNWLFPHRLVTGGRDGISRKIETSRYRHSGRFALFDARGRRLTDYYYSGMKHLLPNQLAYWHWTSDKFEDEQAADSSGLPRGYDLREDFNGPARRYGLIDWHGHEITPPLYVRMETAGPNSLWVVAVEQNRLQYGLIDTLGHYLLPLSPRPLSLPDAAGLLRRYSTAPLPAVESFSIDPQVRYPDTATVQYLHPNGRPAFAGHFAQANAFWQGQALVRQGNLYGLLDTLGRWVVPPQPDVPRQLSYPANSYHEQNKLTDPLQLFEYVGIGPEK